MSESSLVLTERRGHINICTFNRPEARNAVNQEVTIAMADALDAAEADNEVWVHIITGAGDRAFTAGQDLKDLAAARAASPAPASSAPAAPARDLGGWAAISHRDFTKAVIAAVNGAALGGGTEICCVADIVVAEEHAEFGLTEVKMGIVAGAGGMQRLVRRIPPNIAMEYLLTGRRMSAQRAAELGLVNHVVPRGQALTEAIKIAEEICAAAPIAVRATKAMARAAFTDAEGEAYAIGTGVVRGLLNTEDTREGLRAFAEKRAPVWKGR